MMFTLFYYFECCQDFFFFAKALKVTLSKQKDNQLHVLYIKSSW